MKDHDFQVLLGLALPDSKESRVVEALNTYRLLRAAQIAERTQPEAREVVLRCVERLMELDEPAPRVVWQEFERAKE